MQHTESRVQGLCSRQWRDRFPWHWNQFPHYRGLLHMNHNTAANAIKGALNRAMGVVRGISDLEYFYAGRTHFRAGRILLN